MGQAPSHEDVARAHEAFFGCPQSKTHAPTRVPVRDAGNALYTSPAQADKQHALLLQLPGSATCKPGTTPALVHDDGSSHAPPTRAGWTSTGEKVALSPPSVPRELVVAKAPGADKVLPTHDADDKPASVEHDDGSLGTCAKPARPGSLCPLPTVLQAADDTAGTRMPASVRSIEPDSVKSVMQDSELAPPGREWSWSPPASTVAESPQSEIASATNAMAPAPEYAVIDVDEPSSVLTVTQDPRLQRVPQKRSLSDVTSTNNESLREFKKAKQYSYVAPEALMYVPITQGPPTPTSLTPSIGDDQLHQTCTYPESMPQGLPPAVVSMPVMNINMSEKPHTDHLRPYSCSVCGIAFIRVDNRDRHMLLHTGETPYQCQSPNCEAQFYRADKLKDHFTKMHNHKEGQGSAREAVAAPTPSPRLRPALPPSAQPPASVAAIVPPPLEANMLKRKAPLQSEQNDMPKKMKKTPVNGFRAQSHKEAPASSTGDEAMQMSHPRRAQIVAPVFVAALLPQFFSQRHLTPEGFGGVSKPSADLSLANIKVQSAREPTVLSTMAVPTVESKIIKQEMDASGSPHTSSTTASGISTQVAFATTAARDPRLARFLPNNAMIAASTKKTVPSLGAPPPPEAEIVEQKQPGNPASCRLGVPRISNPTIPVLPRIGFRSTAGLRTSRLHEPSLYSPRTPATSTILPPQGDPRVKQKTSTDVLTAIPIPRRPLGASPFVAPTRLVPGPAPAGDLQNANVDLKAASVGTGHISAATSDPRLQRVPQKRTLSSIQGDVDIVSPRKVYKTSSATLPDAIVSWLSEPPSAATNPWCSVLIDPNLAVLMNNSPFGSPTDDQHQLLTTLGMGKSVVAYGTYGYQMHVGVKLAILDSHYATRLLRQTCMGQLSVRPSAIYVSSTHVSCDAFAQALHALNQGPRIVVLSDANKNLRIDPTCEILCITPGRLAACFTQGLLDVTSTGLVVFDEVNMMLTPEVCGDLKLVHAHLRECQTPGSSTTLHIASHLTEANIKELVQSQRSIVPGVDVVKRLVLDGTPHAPSHMLFSFEATATHMASSRIKLAHAFIKRCLEGHRDRAVIVFTIDDREISKPFEQAPTWPGVNGRFKSISQGTVPELLPAGADALLNGTARVLLVSLDPNNTSFLAPTLRHFRGELFVCIARTHPGGENGRGRLRKYHELVARIGRVEQVRECFTIVGQEEGGLQTAIKKWMGSMGRAMPDLVFPQIPTNYSLSLKAAESDAERIIERLKISNEKTVERLANLLKYMQ